jgi:hypothetical protein
MAKVTFDGNGGLILVNYGETVLDVKVDLYSEWKKWVLLSDNSKYPIAISSVGGEPISPGIYLGTTYFLENGWRIRPYEGSHQLTITGNIYTREPGGQPVIPTIGSYQILVNMIRSNLVDTISTGGGSNVDVSEIPSAVWNYMATGSMASNTFGDHVYRKLLTLAQYLAAK